LQLVAIDDGLASCGVARRRQRATACDARERRPMPAAIRAWPRRPVTAARADATRMSVVVQWSRTGLR